MKNKNITALNIFLTFLVIIGYVCLAKPYICKANCRIIEAYDFINNSENGPAFHNERGQKYGSNGFAIVEDNEFLVDSVGRTIIEKTKIETKKYILNEAKYPIDILYYDQYFYVLDLWGSDCSIIKYDKCFNLVKKYNEKHFVPYSFEISDDGVVTVVGEYKNLILKNEELVFSNDGVSTVRKDDNTIIISYDNNDWYIDADENSFIRFITDYNGILFYKRCRIVDGCSELIGELSIEAVDKAGNLLYYMRIDKDEKTFIPFSAFKIYDGNYFYLSVNNERTRLEKISIDNDVDSKFDECIKKAKTINLLEKIRRTDNSKGNPKQITSLYANVTRYQAFNRAINIINTATTWQLKLQNVTIPNNVTDVTLPDYIEAIKNSGILNNGGYSMQVGTPYCWGGFDSIYTSNTDNCSSFTQAINAGNIAGNICSVSLDKVEGTCGLDCSGFVSAVYGLSYKVGTWYLYNYLDSVSSKSDLASMDCIVKPSGHTLLFNTWINYNTGQFSYFESNNPDDYDDRCATRDNGYFDNFINEGFYLRTGW